MIQVIIYENDEGGVSIIRPTDEALALFGIEAIAAKDVPSGKSYFIIDADTLPPRETRSTWVLRDGVVEAWK